MKPPIQLQELVERFSNADLSPPPTRSHTPPEYGPAVPEPQETIQIRNPRTNSSAPNPFDPILIVDGASYFVKVQDGWVNERIPGVNDPATNATAVHEPHNILWGADAVAPDLATDRRKFPITVGQQVSVVAYVSAEGAIELPSGNTDPGPVKIAIETEDFKSIHYVPPRPVDLDVGIAGEYHYKLAILRAADATHSGPWLELFLAGSHLDHFRDLPILDNCAAAGSKIGRPFFKYKKDTNTYLFRSIDTNSGQLRLTEVDGPDSGSMNLRGNEFNGDIQISAYGGSPQTLATVLDGLTTSVTAGNIPLPDAIAGGGNLDLHIVQFYENSDGFVVETTEGKRVLVWRKGAYLAAYAAGAQPATLDPLDTEYVSHYNQSLAPP